MGFVDDFYYGQCKLTIVAATADNNKTVSIASSGGRTWSGTISSGKCEFLLPPRDKYTVQVLNGGVPQYTEDILLGYGECRELQMGLRTDTWEGIQNILNAHLENSMLNVGDEMDVTIGGETVTFQIAAIDLESSHQLIWCAKNAMATTRAHHSSNTNAGGWNSSDLRSYLNTTLFSALPVDLQGVIAERTFYASQGSQSSSLQAATDKVFLPREYEIFGATTYAAATEHTGGDEAQQWPIFATAANRIKTQGAGGAAVAWWECSPNVSGSTNFCYVYTSGAANYNDASYSRGVVPCFQMIAAA